MNEDGLELDLPEDRTDFLRSLTMGVRSAKEQKAMAEKAMTTPTERMDSGGAFTQILTSVLPLVLGAAIAGKRGGMVGADVGGAANQNLFALGDKKRKEKEAMAKVKYQEASDAEKAALAKLASGTEGMIRDDNQEKNRAASDARQSKNLAQQLKIALINEGGRNSRNEGNNAWKDRDREDKQANQKDLSLLNFEQDTELQDTKLNSQEKMNRDRILASRDNLFTQIAATADRDDRKMTHEDMLTEGKYTQEEKMAGLKFTAAEKLQANKIKADLENLKTSLSSRALTSAQDRESREKIAANSLEGQNQRTDKVITAAKDRLVYGEEGRKERQQIGFENEQSKFKKPGLTTMIDPETGAPYKKTAQEHTKTTEIRDGYLSAQTYIDGMYDSLDNDNLQSQIKNFYGLINSVKRIEGYGAAFSAFEALLAQAGLPQVFDADYGGVARWFKGKARGGQMQEIMDVFNSDLNRSTQSRLANNKERFVPPPARGKRAMYKGEEVMYTGTVGPDLKPVIVSVKPKVTQ